MIKVLVVDDEPLFCEVVSEFLDAEAECALTGKQGAQLIRVGGFDLAVINIRQSDYSGLDLAELAANENLPVLLTAGHPEHRRQLARAALPFLGKPFDRTDLAAKAAEILGATADNIRRVKESVAKLRATGDALRAVMADSTEVLDASRKVVENLDRPAPATARVVLVHDEPEFLDPLAAALRRAGYNVATFRDPMAAWDIWDSQRNVEILITRVRFAPGKPNGISLARMARFKRPGLRVLFTARQEFAEHADGLGTFMPTPVLIPDVVAFAGRLLQSGDRGSA